MIWIDTLVQGAMLGGLYALFALGLSLTFGVMRLVNLAHGDLILLGSYLIVTLAGGLLLPPVVAAVLALPVMFALGWLVQRLVLNRVLGRDILPPLIVTFGLSILIQNGLLALFTADSRRLSLGGAETASLSLGPVHLGLLPALTLGAAVAAVLELNLLFFHTKLGRAFRATSDDPVTLGLMGRDARAVFALTTGVAMAVAGIAALFPGDPGKFQPLDRPGAADLRLRGGDHRRARLVLGHACGGHRAGRRPDAGRRLRPRVAGADRASGLYRNPLCAAARPVPARLRLKGRSCRTKAGS